ncbi:MAG: hypothetical protein ACWIPH_05945 [Ostreibacterium sp.]
MKNKLIDLNNHLFSQIERLGDEDLKADALAVEIERSKAISNVASKIIDNASVAVQTEKLRAEYGAKNFSNPLMIEHKDGQ